MDYFSYKIQLCEREKQNLSDIKKKSHLLVFSNKQMLTQDRKCAGL